MSKNLVIVESPAKARTLGRILGKKYSLKASMGHVRDLPRGTMGVDVDNGFTPKYVVPRSKSKVVKDLKEKAANASAVYLATDPDREGEAIAWHLSEVTALDRKRYRRVVFHEITEEAIERAFRHPRSIDLELVNAQQARRIMDRLVGYKISPLLWKKVQRGLSAGRVQSVAVRIIVEREREIEKFTPQEYWTIEADLSPKDKDGEALIRAGFVGLGDGTKLDIDSEAKAEDICRELREAKYRVTGVKTKKVSRRPSPPFITSTLQQESGRRFRFTARKTMLLAQQLYEGIRLGDEGSVGLITYMRTDSTRVARSAVNETREFIRGRYGPDYVPPRVRSFTKAVKGAQEAHEAIRPTRIGREPSSVKKYLDKDQFRLYQLIWQRMVASQMSDAVFSNTSVIIEAKRPYSKGTYLFRASSSVVKFPGFMSLYTVRKEEDEEEEKKAPLLPHLVRGQGLNLVELYSGQHFTQPPSRFTEASLIKTLEQNGIGRPSTYATILATIQEREYVSKVKGSLHPTELGKTVNDQLIRHFNDIINVDFTARMEEELDEVGSRKREWVDVLKDFYIPFDEDLRNAAERMEKVKPDDEELGEACPDCGKALLIKHGRYGKFIACGGYPKCRYKRPYDDGGESEADYGKKSKSAGEELEETCPDCGKPLVVKASRYGKFIACSGYPECKYKRSYGKGIKKNAGGKGEVKPAGEELDEVCPDCGKPLVVKSGRYGKFIACSGYPKCRYKRRLKE